MQDFRHCYAYIYAENYFLMITKQKRELWLYDYAIIFENNY
jgi:hypothetical protein